MTLARLLAVLAALGGASAASAEPGVPAPRYAPKGSPSRLPRVDPATCTEYFYVGFRETVGAHSAGAGATLLQADPAIGVGDFHSLAEIVVESVGAQHQVELGWTIDPVVNGDLQPHLFTFHWVDGQQTCYNACGWVQVSPDKLPGMRVVPGEAHRYEIRLIHGDWWLLYDGEAMGYYPASEWHGRFTEVTLVQWFGEVAAAGTAPCTQMGNGRFGIDTTSAAYDDLHLFDPDGTRRSAEAQPGALTNANFYAPGRVTATSFGFGGPGGTGCCMPSTCLTERAECGTVPDPVCGGALACGACRGTDVCTADHTCPGGIGPRDDGEQFDAPVPDRAGGGCCDAGVRGPGGPGALVLAALVAAVARRRRAQVRWPRFCRSVRGPSLRGVA